MAQKHPVDVTAFFCLLTRPTKNGTRCGSKPSFAKSVQFALDGALAKGQPDVGDSRSTTAQGLTTVPPKPPDVDPEHITDEQKAMIAANLQPDCPDPVEAHRRDPALQGVLARSHAITANVPKALRETMRFRIL